MSNSIFFTSDTHFGHTNIIKYCKRPFATVQEMDEVMTERWNSVVKPGDRVYHLGDFSWGDPYKYLNKLNGQKYFIIGNHDKIKDHEATRQWQWIKDYHELKVGDQSITLHHYAQRVWNKMHHKAWHLFGHTHGTLPAYGYSFDAGVDCWNFTPISYDQVAEKIKTLEFVSGIPE